MNFDALFGQVIAAIKIYVVGASSISGFVLGLRGTAEGNRTQLREKGMEDESRETTRGLLPITRHRISIVSEIKESGAGRKCVWPAGVIEVLSKNPLGNCSINR
jgi:hypothetical protein